MALADHAFFQRLLELEHGLDVVGDHAPHGNPGPAGDDLRDGTRIHHRQNHRLEALQGFQLSTQGIECGHGIGAGGVIGGQRFHLVEFGVDLRDQLFFLLKAGLVGGQQFTKPGGLFADFRQPLAVIGTTGGFFFQLRTLSGQYVQAPTGVFNFGGCCILTNGDLGAGGIQYADGLVRQLAAGNKARAELDCLGDGFVEDAHFVMCRHRLTHAAQHRNRLVVVWLINLDDLETAGQRGVFFEIFLVFAPRGGGNRAHFTARQCGLQQVGGIVLAGCAPGTNQGVRFVDKHDDRRSAGFDFINHAFQTIFEFTLHRRAGLQQTQI